MADKIKILHIIDSLQKGGAEKLLVDCMEEIQKNHPEAEQFLWTLHQLPNEFEVPVKVLRICKNISLWNFVKCISTVNEFIAQHEITVIHAHLVDSIILSRLLKGKSIKKKFFTYHNFYYSKKFVYYSAWRTLVEKLTYRKKYISIYVSKEIQKSVNAIRGLGSRDIVLDNFYNPGFSYQYKNTPDTAGLKIIIVANLRETKNLFLAVKEMAKLKQYAVSIDIYGEGNLRSSLQKEIDAQGVSVNLKGSHTITSELLSNYDIFLLTSESEGLPISLLEAMATGLPCLLPDHLPVFKEVAEEVSVFYSIHKAGELSEKIVELLGNKERLLQLSENTKEIIKRYQIEGYLKSLFELYDSTSILYLINNLNVGGAEELLVNTANELVKKEHLSIHLATTKVANGILKNKLSPKIHYSHFVFNRLLYIKGFFALRNYVRDNNIDIIHGHLESSIIISRLVDTKRIKLYATYHNMEFSPKAVYYGYWRVLLEKLTFRKRYFSVYVSEEVKKVVEAVRETDPNKSLVLPNFSTATIHGDYKVKPLGSLKLLTLANLKVSKNITFILDVMSDLKEYPVSWDICGDGPLRTALELEIKRRNCNVRILGNQVVNNDLFDPYDFFAMSSLMEGMPIALLEAIRYGIPSLLPDHLSVMKEVGGNSAYYFSIYNKEELKNILIQQIKDKSKLAAMSEAALKQSELFSTQLHIENLIAFYKK